MSKIAIETFERKVTVERETDERETDEDIGWIELAKDFGNALTGLGYYLPDDWEEYLERKEEQNDKSVNIFDELTKPSKKSVSVSAKDEDIDFPKQW
jgi:hypothetical protein